MVKILVVEGNSREILERNRAQGFDFASTCYQRSLALHRSEATFEMIVPFAPEFDTATQPYDAYDAIALTGSGVPYCAHDHGAKPYMKTLDRLLQSKRPIIGSCWGMQTVAVALGGRCGPNPKGTEAGVARDIKLTETGRQHPVFAGLPQTFASPCIHRDHVLDLPRNAVHLAFNDVSTFQAMSYNADDIDFFGVQFHPELEIDYINKLLERRGSFPEHERTILHQAKADDPFIHDPKQRTAILGNWLNQALKTKMAA